MTARVMIAIGGTILVIALNYCLALAGEPRALWLFRDVLGGM